MDSAYKEAFFNTSRWQHLGLYVLVLGGVLLGLFYPAFHPDMAHFSNDGPLAVQSTEYLAMPGAWTGVWGDISWLGWNGGSMFPHISSVLMFLLTPVGYAKFLVPVSLFLLGMCAAWCFRQFGFRPMVCLLAGLAAALNMNFFSNACWGLASRALQVAMVFLALGAILCAQRRQTWLRTAFAGCAIGMNVMEGADVGAIFSLYMAAFAFFLFTVREGPALPKLAKGVGGVVVMAVLAGFVAYQTVTHMVGFQIRGVVGAEQTQESKEQRWDWATQWSLPKAEGLRVVVPGLFGYRLDSPDGGAYWGRVGQQPGWDQHRQGFPRHSGSGEYAGMLVVVVALWGVLQSLRREKRPYTALETKVIWFWGVAAVISLLLAFGRHAPFYQFIYPLPYFSTIRNPMKFMHPFHLALLVLFGFGLQGLCRMYLEQAGARAGTAGEQLRKWWASLKGFERQWTRGAIVAVAMSLFAWLIYASSQKGLVAHLQKSDFPGDLPQAIARFSVMEVGWAILFLVLTLGALAVVMSGALSGGRARWALALLGVILVTDLARADSHFVVFYNWKEKYASNPVIDLLRERRYEQRVGILPFRFPEPFGMFQQFYNVEWLQHHFVYYNIQALDISQQPRKPQEQAAYERALLPDPANMAGTVRRIVRYWELTNTRLFFAPAGAADEINRLLDPERRRFQQRQPFALIHLRERLYTAVTNATGPFALIEFTGALPRARLYGHWEVSPDDEATLKKLPDPAFDVHSTVLVDRPPPAEPPASGAGPNAGTVEFASYAPKRIAFKAQALAPAVLLLNDRYDAAWKVSVDGQPAPLLRCNFIMRGVFLTPGEHEVVFEFKPPVRPLYVTLAGLACWLALTLVMWVGAARRNPAVPPPGAAPTR